MRPITLLSALSALAVSMVAAILPAHAQQPATPATKSATPTVAASSTWSASGTLLESCTCAVPCTCNFGQGPSPNSYCHATFAYRLDKAHLGDIDLSGLIVGGADGPAGDIGILDSRATPAQRPALERLARLIFAQGGPSGGKRPFVSATIEHSVQGNNLHLGLGDYGGFTAAILIGRDGKSPVVVENNTTWPIPRATKAKASELRFSAPGVREIKAAGVNSNYGAFNLSGRLDGKSAPAATGSCCEKR